MSSLAGAATEQRLPIHAAHEALLPVAPYDPLRERQYDMWWRHLIAGPSRNAAGVRGNDFPGLYLFEPLSSTEYCIFFDGSLDWSQSDCGLTVRGDTVYLGFWSQAELEGTLVWRTRQLEQRLDRWDALVELMTWCCGLLPPAPSIDTIADYRETAARALTEARDPASGLLEVGGALGHRMYIVGSSEAWRDAVVDHIELLCQGDIAWPLRFHRGTDWLAVHQSWATHLTNLLGVFYDPHLEAFSNSFPLLEPKLHGGNVITTRSAGREATNCWYHLYNHARLLELALLAEHDGGDAVPWRAKLRRAVDHTMLLAAANRYHFPLFWWLDSGEPFGGVDDFGAAGAFAWLAVRAYDLFGDSGYLNHAAAALDTLYRLPLDTLYAEATLLPRAAWAAHALISRLGDERWRRSRDAFTAAALRMMYWQPPYLGMFQACAGMCYPALFENVGVMLAFDPFLDETPFPLRALLGHQLGANRRFFDGKEPGANVPLENLYTPEYPFEGAAGKEIYGVGEVLWLPYLSERFAGATGCLLP